MWSLCPRRDCNRLGIKMIYAGPAWLQIETCGVTGLLVSPASAAEAQPETEVQAISD